MTSISRKLVILVLMILLTIGSISGKFGTGIGGISAVAAAVNIPSQDGIGHSGSIPGNEVVGTTFTGYQAWPSGFSKESSAFVGGVYDGTSIWMIPYNASELIKVNPSTGEMTGYSNWPTGFTKGSNAFAGGVYDGTNIWLIPYSANQVVKVNATTGEMTGYSDWPGGSRGSEQYIGGTFDGTHIWLTPYSGSRLIKVDTKTGAMTSYNSWPSGTILGTYPFYGSIFDGTSIWLIPNGADRLIKVDPATGDMTGFNNWPSGFTKGIDAFWGGVFDGTNIWLIPYNAPHVVKVDTTTGVMTGYDGWPSGFTKGNGSFAGGVYDRTNIWLMPQSANMLVKVNATTGDMTGFDNWPSGFTKGSKAFLGGVYDGESVWMIPFMADRLMKFGDSSNANLSSLVLSAGAPLNPTFAPGTESYTASVANGVSGLTITPTVAEAGASVKVNGATVTSGVASGAIPLTIGANSIIVEVTAQDGNSIQTYTVTVTRATASSGGGAQPSIPTEPEPEPSIEPPITEFMSAVNITKLEEFLKGKIEQAQTNPVGSTFTDLNQHWAKESIHVFTTIGAVNGYKDGTFRPNASVTRAEFAAIIARVFRIEPLDNPGVLKDVKNHWASNEISALASNGIITGYGDGTFKPTKVISRAEIVAIISRIVNYDAVDKEQHPTVSFKDVEGTWNAQGIYAAVSLGIVQGRDTNTFAPGEAATRAEALTMILRVLNLNTEIKALLDQLKSE